MTTTSDILTGLNHVINDYSWAAEEDADIYADLLVLRDKLCDFIEEQKPVSALSSYDLIDASHTGEDIYNWCLEQMAMVAGPEQTVAELLLQKYWGSNQIIPRKGIFYRITPLQFGPDGKMFVQLIRDTRKSPRPDKKG